MDPTSSTGLSPTHVRPGHFDPNALHFERPPSPLMSFDEMHFYSAMTLPDGTKIRGAWDLRGAESTYLGNVDFARNRVLEIGPASGFLTQYMEHQGADVICIEVPESIGWDFVPFGPDVLTAETLTDRRRDMRRMRHSFWYIHQTYGLKAKLLEADVYNLPSALGRFDIAVLAAVLLHTKSPHLVLAEVAKRADMIVITEPHTPHLDNCGPVLRLWPTHENRDWGTWWRSTPAFFRQYLAILGFAYQRISYHEHKDVINDRVEPNFTIVATKTGAPEDRFDLDDIKPRARQPSKAPPASKGLIMRLRGRLKIRTRMRRLHNGTHHR
jgi:Methyltransferase domain